MTAAEVKDEYDKQVKVYDAIDRISFYKGLKMEQDKTECTKKGENSSCCSLRVSDLCSILQFRKMPNNIDQL